MTPRVRPLVALVAIAAAMPALGESALGQSATGSLAVSVTVSRACAVQTTGAASGLAQVTLACSRGVTPALVGSGPVPMPMLMPAATTIEPLAPTPAAAAATSSQPAASATRPASPATIAAAEAVAAAAAQARFVTPMQTMTVIAATQAIDGARSGDASGNRLVTINF